MDKKQLSKLSPMMQHYLTTKEEHKDCILFYRLGDFYEMFFEDAVTVSKELELTLTGKNCGLDERAPMCGVPYHAVEGYLNRLVEKGYKVAICEQVESPKMARGMVKREVVRIVTPGTNIDNAALDESKNNFLMCVVYLADRFGLAIADISTGEFLTTEVDSLKKLNDEIYKFSPAELVCNDAFFVSGINLEEYKQKISVSVYPLEDTYFNDEMTAKLLCRHFKAAQLSALGLEPFPNGTVASGALLAYLYDTQKNSLSQMTAIHPYSTGMYMVLDNATRRNLELVETMREKQKRGSLLWVLDKTKTAMGARLLRSFVEQPLIDAAQITERLDAVEELSGQLIEREELREYLSPIYDMERLISRVAYQTANPRDLLSFKNSISMLPPIKALMKQFQSPLLKELTGELDELPDIYKLIEDSIDEEAPISVHEGGIIKNGYHEEITRLRRAKTDGKSWLAKLEAEEREKTGIRNLKIKYNKVFGYYLEVTNSNKSLVPEYYIRKQTLTNAERYITPELKEMEDTILGAEERLTQLEYELFSEIRSKISEQVVRIQASAKSIAWIDVLASFSVVASQNNYCRPQISKKGGIDVKQGRHPVVEKMIENDMFIANDVYLDKDKNRVSIITGPNMAGKSTYMRQCALIVLMAQIGSFVPAKEAKISICDRIFTRVGASDDLASGQSTFMVEMNEVANILRNATSDSLIILDEIGRGTSTFDGLSIAWAVVEHISNPKLIGAKTLFATHYHELTELEGKLDSVHNYCIAVKENGDDIVFLRKIIPGGADKSYGIQVAKLAGVPDVVIERAKEILQELISQDILNVVKDLSNSLNPVKQNIPENESLELAQISLFDTVKNDDIIEEIRSLDIGMMTPLDALNKLFEIQNKIKNRW